MSVSNYIHCLQCTEIALAETYYPSFDLDIRCPVCGYYFERRQVIDRKHKANYKYFELYRLTQDGQLIYEENEKKGFGSYFLETESGFSCFGGFHDPITEEDIAEFRERISSPDINPERSYLTSWNDETNRVEAIIGKIVNPYEDMEDELAEEDW